MHVKSIFEFRFMEGAIEEGVSLVSGIGSDMTSLQGYHSHEVIQDLQDAGHLIVITEWVDASSCYAVLKSYAVDPKIKRANELIPNRPKGFVGKIFSR